ncbi:MAG: polyprenyl synthetase family protein [Candidatus Bathyarchaeia archaeon]
MGWEETLDQYGALIEEKLKNFFEDAINTARVYHPFIGKVYSNIREFVLRKGKRLASCSTLLTYKGYAGNVNDQILRACVGIELYRHCILAHDDLIDRDALRRGGKTLHLLFAGGYDRRLGEGTAVFTGDILYAQALQCLITSGFPQEKLGKVAYLL